MDWRLNGKNAEQNYKIIMDKGAVRMGGGGEGGLYPSSAYPGTAAAPAFPLPPPKSFQNARGSVMCVIP